MVIRINKRIIAFVCAVVISITVFVAAKSRNPSDDCIRMPAIMYHLINEDAGQSGKYVVTPAQFEKDMQYLCDNGYTAVTIKQLIDFAEKGTALPEKPILITFDDGYESFYMYAFPILKKAGMSAVLSVIGTYSELYSNSDDHNVRYAHCTWEHIAEMSHSDNVDIGNHTWDLHTLEARKGCTKMSSESCKQYSSMLKDDVGKLQAKLKEVTGEDCPVFTYPYGRYCKEARQVISEMGFKITLGCEEKVNLLTPNDPDCLKMIKRFNRPAGMSSKEFFDKMT